MLIHKFGRKAADSRRAVMEQERREQESLRMIEQERIQSFIKREALTLTPLAPQGDATVDDDIVEVKARSGNIPAQTRVISKSMDGKTPIVEPQSCCDTSSELVDPWTGGSIPETMNQPSRRRICTLDCPLSPNTIGAAMNHPFTRPLVLTGLLLLCSNSPLSFAAENETAKTRDVRPNFLVILCDDLGYGDLQCYGHPIIETPNLNRLADSGIRFTSFYSCAPVCSPSRVGLLTGRSPNRAGVYDWIPASSQRTDRPMVQMRPEETTIAELLKGSGYATCMAGKWHCNAAFNAPEQAQPGDQGFDHSLATQNNAAPSHENPLNFVRNGRRVGPLTGYSCQLVAEEIIEWLKQHTAAQPQQPFFAYCAFHEPHEPVASPADLVAKYLPQARNEDEAQFFANVENVDRAVGRLLETLQQLRLHENTLVVFSSDNGPETLNRYRGAERSYGRPGPLRGMKLHTHDGGFRVAGIAAWPTRIRPGQISSQVASALDLLPTFCKLSETSLPTELVLDGTDLSPAFDGQSVDRTKPLVWAYYNSLNEACVALRDGPWKVLGVLDEGKLAKKTNLTSSDAQPYIGAHITEVEIYRIANDIGETDDLARKDPALRQQWIESLDKAYHELVEGSHIW